MHDKKLDARYWDKRYATGSTGWDLGRANSGLIQEVRQRASKDDRILIPGAGSAYEAEALWNAGFVNTVVVDWAPQAFTRLRSQDTVAHFAKVGVDVLAQTRVTDFFDLNSKFDLLLEQTFFCALPPAQRPAYVEQAYRLLQPNGQWLGILFNREFPTSGPPFGGTLAEYKQLFSRFFHIDHLDVWNHSVGPRLGSELLGVMRCRTDI